MMNKWKKAALVVVTVMVFLAAPTTLATAAQSNCAAGYTCIWRDTNYQTNGLGGTLTRLQQYIPNLSTHEYRASNGSGTLSGFTSNNSATSVYNNGNFESARYYKDNNGNGAGFTLSPGGARVNLATSISPAGFNDTISSIYFTSWDPNL